MNKFESDAAERHKKLRQKHNAPSAYEQAASLLKSSVKFVSSGFKFVSDQIYNQRKEICLRCEFWERAAFSGIGRCLKCGCSSAKLKLAHEKCPIGRWGAELT